MKGYRLKRALASGPQKGTWRGAILMISQKVSGTMAL
jgi:hypothetical protein